MSDVRCPLSRSAILLLSVALGLQGVLLAYMSRASWPMAAGLISAGAILGYLLMVFFKKNLGGFVVNLIFAMLALGNVGMLIGWTAEWGFGPLIRNGVCLCGCCNSPIGQGATQLTGWMYSGMALAGLPCFWLIPFGMNCASSQTFRRILNLIHGLICTACMLAGMWVGAEIMTYFSAFGPRTRFFLTFIAMSVGMSAGMVMGCYAWRLVVREFSSKSNV
jgi:hypothetical protein